MPFYITIISLNILSLVFWNFLCTSTIIVLSKHSRTNTEESHWTTSYCIVGKSYKDVSFWINPALLRHGNPVASSYDRHCMTKFVKYERAQRASHWCMWSRPLHSSSPSPKSHEELIFIYSAKSGGVCNFIYNPKSYEYSRSRQKLEREEPLVVELVSEALVLAGRREICQVTAEYLTGRKTGLTKTNSAWQALSATR